MIKNFEFLFFSILNVRMAFECFFGHAMFDLHHLTRSFTFSQAGNELEVSSLLARNELLNAFPIHHVSNCERARSQTG
jgi:hypothetical protein